MTAMPLTKKKNAPKASPTPIRIGFDLDGVVLYNPARIIRRPVSYTHLDVYKRQL